MMILAPWAWFDEMIVKMDTFQQMCGKILPKTTDELYLGKIKEVRIGADVVFLLKDCADDFFQGNYQDSLDKAQELLDQCWEKLNTGHWKDVDIAWRHIYTYASFLKAMSICKDRAVRDGDTQAILYQRALKACDMGLLMGAPVLDNLLSRLARMIQALLKTLQPSNSADLSGSHESQDVPDEPSLSSIPRPAISNQFEIPRVPCPSLLHFQSQYMETKTPVIICGAMEHWPAMGARKWSLQYLHAAAGNRTVPIEIGAKYTDESWSQTLMTVSEFISKYIEKKESVRGKGHVGYLAQHQLFYQIPELRNDICIPDYCCLHGNKTESKDEDRSLDLEADDADVDSQVDINAWFGPAGTVSPLHTDPKHNCLAQVVGEKYVRLYHEDMTPRVYPHQERLLHNTSKVDVENPDLSKFPLFAEAVYQEAILRPGEMLYIPPGCWHYVRSLSTSFSVSFWWS